MIKIYCVVQNNHDGAYTSRVAPIKHLEETGYKCVVQCANEITDSNIEWADIVMIHRPTQIGHLAIAERVKVLGKKLWIDFDDDYLNIPIDHAAHLFYLDKTTRANIETISKMADLLTFSSVELKKTYQHFNPNSHMYLCGYDERLMPMPDYSPRNKRVLWRGSDTHAGSMVEFAESVGKVDKLIEGWEFVFIGAYPWQMLKQITKNNWYCSTGYMPYQNMWAYTRELKPAIQMVCLSDNQFTKSRSAMAMIDGTIAGAVTLARDWDHFKVDGVTTYSGVDTFVEQLVHLTTNDNKKDVELNFEYIKANLTFEVINKGQWEFINDLLT